MRALYSYLCETAIWIAPQGVFAEGSIPGHTLMFHICTGAVQLDFWREVTFLALSAPGSRSLAGNTKDLSGFGNPKGLIVTY